MKKLLPILALFCILASMLQAKEAPTVTVKTIEPFKYASVEMTGSYDKHTEAFNTLTEAITMQSLSVDGIPFGIYHDNPMHAPEDQLKWEVGFELTEKAELKEPLVLKSWDFTTVAVLEFEGVFGGDKYNAAIGTLFQWLGENGYQPVGPMMERFITLPEDTGNGIWKGKVESWLPVQK